MIQFLFNLIKKLFMKPLNTPEAIPETTPVDTPIQPLNTPPANVPQQSVQMTPSEKLYLTAKLSLGATMVPPPDDPELGCAISVNKVHERAFGHQIGGGTSTLGLLRALIHDASFMEMTIAQPGDIIVSATGTSTVPNTPISHGHTGIIGIHGIMSNNSFTGLWSENYTLDSWKARYEILGGYPTRLFKKVIN